MPTVQVTDASFEADVLSSSQPVLVDFWADWCAPCKRIAPALEQISDEFAGQVTVAKVDIVDNPTTPSRLGVRNIPTLMLFRDGDMIAVKAGAGSKTELLAWMAESGVIKADA